MTSTDLRGGGVFALSASERIAFGAGAFATATYAVVPGLVLLYYLTNVLGVGAAVAGFVVFLPKLLDVVYNPIVGRLSDSTVSRLGPRRPWMIAGMISLPLGFVSIFFAPVTGNAGAWWVAIALALTGLGFAAFVVPYGVLPAELGASSEERTSMTAWRMVFLGVAVLGAGALAPLIAAVDGGGREGHRIMAVVMGAVIFLGTCAALYSARRSSRTAAGSATAPGSLREALTAARRNRPFRVLCGVFMLVEVVISAALAGLPYMAEQILGNAEAVAPLFVCVLGPMLLTMPVWSRSARRFGDKRCLLVALAVFGAGTFAVTVLPWAAESSRIFIAGAALLVAGVGFAGAQLLTNTMLADTLAGDAGESGQRRAGMLVGLWSAGETTAAAAGAGIYGFALAAGGFVSSTGDEVVTQPPSALWGMVLGFSVTAGVCTVAALALMTRYAPPSVGVAGSVVRSHESATD